MLHAPTPVLREMCKRYSEFITPSELRVSIGTYNVNGGKHFRSVVYKDLSLIDWLAPKNGKLFVVAQSICIINNSIYFALTDAIIDIEHSDSVYDKMADIYAIGFQEIVDLNASNIVAASSDNAKACENSQITCFVDLIKTSSC